MKLLNYLKAAIIMLDLYAKTEQLDKNTEELLNKLCSIDNSIDAESIRVVQYLVEAAKH